MDEPAQFSIFGDIEAPEPYRKAVQVLHSKPKSPLTLLQRKLGNAWLKNAVETDPDDQGWWRLGIAEMARYIRFDSNNRSYLKEAAEGLMRVVFEWDVVAPRDKRVQWKASVLFPEIEIHNDVIRYQISSQIRERLINPEIYALIDMAIVRRFRRAASLAIWEFCVRFDKVGRTAAVPWEEFRDMLLGESAEAKTFQEYRYFKNRAINPAIAEINSETHHTIELIETKVGKRVALVAFNVRRKVVVSESNDGEISVELLGDLLQLGVPQSEAKKLLSTHSFEQVRAAFEYTKVRMADKMRRSLDNPAAYFRHALANGYTLVQDKAAAKPISPEPTKGMDLKAAFAARRVQEADAYFNELDPAEQAALIERYNTQQGNSLFRVKKRATKVAQAALFAWLATDTWGEPTTDDLLGFAQEVWADGRSSILRKTR